MTGFVQLLASFGNSSSDVVPGVTLKLTSRSNLTGQNFANRHVMLSRDGILYHSDFSSFTGVSYADEWVQVGRSATVGDSFEVSFDSGAWQRLNANRSTTRTSGAGTINVRIRKYQGTGAILAQANFTFSS